MKSKQNSAHIVRDFKKLSVLVIGDVMLDSYIMGDIERISAEAPVPIVMERSTRHALGGAANVANNTASLGAKTYLAGLVGVDEEGDIIKNLCKEQFISSRGIVGDPSRPTTTKTRVIVQHHQVMRLDKEEKKAASPDSEKKMIAFLKTVKKPDLVIFSDYAKGAVTAGIVKNALRLFKRSIIVADFKPSQAELYKNIGLTAILPNIKEAEGLTGIEATTEELAEEAIRRLVRNFGTSVVLKRGEFGMTLLEAGGEGIVHIPTRAREVFDVTGAGDTVIAAMGLALALGLSFIDAAGIANHAAGVVVEMHDTATVTPEALFERLSDLQ
jgi:rfaE bifunctional protein kinase chain/domain